MSQTIKEEIGVDPELEYPPVEERDWESKVRGDTGKVKELLQKLCKDDRSPKPDQTCSKLIN